MRHYTLTHPDGTREEFEFEQDLIDTVSQRYQVKLSSDELSLLESHKSLTNIEDGRDTWSISR